MSVCSVFLNAILGVDKVGFCLLPNLEDTRTLGDGIPGTGS